METENNIILLETALKYIERGIPVFFVIGKHPPHNFKWGRLKNRLPTATELREWFEKYPGITGIAMVTGKLSGVIAIDGDIKDPDNSVDPEIPKKLKSEGHPEAQTASLGSHHLVAFDPSLGFTSNNGVLPGLDIKSQGGYILIEPSVGFYGQDEPEYQKYNGNQYKWIEEFKSKDDLKPFPEWLLGMIKQNKKGLSDKHWKETFVSPIIPGTRNGSFASIVGGLLKRFPMDEWEILVWPTVQDKNKLQEKPLGEAELRTVYDSIAKREQIQQGKSKVGETSIACFDELGLQIKTETESGNIYCNLSEILISSQSIDADVAISIEPKEGEIIRSFRQRINLLSLGAVDSLATRLSRAHGGRRDADKGGYNWDLILNDVVLKAKETLKDAQQPKFFTDSEYVEPKFLFYPFVQDNVPNVLFGQSEVGKSFWALNLAVSFAMEIEFLGVKAAERGKTLYLDYEDDETTFISRLYKVCRGLNMDYKAVASQILYYQPLGDIKGSTDVIRKMVAKNNISLMIIDAGGDASGGPSKEECVLSMFNALKSIPCANLILHHEPKKVNNESQPYYGSTYWKNRSRISWRLETEKEENGVKTIKMSIQKASNMSRQPDIYYNFIWDNSINPVSGELFAAVKLERIDNVQNQKGTQDVILDILSGGKRLKVKELHEMANTINAKIALNPIKNCLSRMRKAGLVDNKNGEWFISVSNSGNEQKT